jgi:hypothetical protein
MARSAEKEFMLGCRASAATVRTLNNKARGMGMKPAQLHGRILKFVLDLMRDEHRENETLEYFLYRVLGKK